MIVGHSTYADKPGLFATAPIGALRKLSEKTNWNLRDVDLFEINEAFAVVPMAAMRDLDLPHERSTCTAARARSGIRSVHRGARDGDAAGRARNVRVETRRRVAVHRRRRGDGDRDRAHRVTHNA